MRDSDIVCNCNGVSKGTILSAIRDKGCANFEGIKGCTGAARSCGGRQYATDAEGQHHACQLRQHHADAGANDQRALKFRATVRLLVHELHLGARHVQQVAIAQRHRW